MTVGALKPLRTEARPPRRTAAARSFRNPKKSATLTIAMLGLSFYTLLPLAWLIVNSTKTQNGLLTTFGLWFAEPFVFFQNIVETFAYDDGVYGRWLLNTLLYVVVGAGGATILATMAGYGLARFDFPGKKVVFGVVLGAIAIPGTALAVPTFLMFSAIGLTNGPLAVLIPSLLTPFGLYLIWTYAKDAVAPELLEAARVDGAGELRIFFSIALRLLMPGFITVLLFTVVATWNNYFLPLIMLSDPSWFPLTVGLNQWSAQAISAGGNPIYNLLITGSLLSLIPIVTVFLLLQKYWQSGLASGGVKQ